MTNRKVSVCALFPGKQPCQIMCTACTNSAWFQSSTDLNCSSIQNALSQHFAHLKSKCKCVTKAPMLITIGNSLVDKFQFLLQQIIVNLGKAEFDLKNNSQLKISSETFNDVKDPETNLTSVYNKYFTSSNANVLMEPIILALKYYENAFKADEKYLTETICDNLKILEMLNSLFQVFNYYDMESEAVKTINLTICYIKKYYQTKKGDMKEEVLIAYCNAVRLFLNAGCFETARSLYKNLFSDNPAIFASDVNSYGLGLKFLLYTEITLRSHKGNQIAKELKTFIQSDYLSKNTIKRFALRAMAYFLASRFPSSFYEYSDNCSEFFEPLQMAVSICRRWRLFNSFGSPTFVVEKLTLDPVWYQFSIFNLIKDCFDTFVNFYMGTGILSDAGFYFRIVVNLNILTLNIIGLSKLELIGAHFDLFLGFISDAKIKVSLFKSLFNTETISDVHIFDAYVDKPHDNKSKKSSFEDSISIICNQFNLQDDEWNKILAREQSSSNPDVLELYSRLGRMNKLQDTDEFEEFTSKFKNSSNQQLWDLIQKELSQIKIKIDQYKSIFHLYFRLVLIQLMIEDEQATVKTAINSFQYRFFLGILESYSMKLYLPSFERLVKSSILKTLNVKTSIDEQITHGPISDLFWFLSISHIEPLIARRSYDKALFYLNKLVNISAYSFPDRLSRCKMYYNRAFVIFELTKQQHEAGSKKFFKIDTNICPIENVEPDNTPVKTKASTTKKSLIPKAPNRPMAFASSTIKNYAESLLNVAGSSRDVPEGTRRNLVLNFDEEVSSTSSAKLVEPKKKGVKSTTKKSTTKKAIAKCPILQIDIDINAESELAIYRDADCVNDELISDFNRIVSFNQSSNLSQLEDAIEDGTYFSKLFDLNQFNRETDISRYSFVDLKSSLSKILNYLSHHPTIYLYNKLMYLYFEFYHLIMKGNSSLVYFFSESFQYTSYRYRSMFIAHKKFCLKKSYVYNVEDFQFSFKDFNGLSYELPINWRFVQIKVIDNGSKLPDLMLCRYQYKSKPVFIKVQCNPEKMLKFFMIEFEEIMQANNASIVQVVRETFWKLRYEINDRLKLLLESVESNWLGSFRGIFLGKVNNNKLFTNACLWFKKKVLEAATQHKLECSDGSVLDVLIESVVCLQNEEIGFAFKSLFNTDNLEFIDLIKEFKKKYFKAWPTADKVKELFSEVEPVGLILDSQLVQFPFESLPFVRQLHQPFFRVPSLRIASIMYKRYKDLIDNGVDDANSYYILNPSNNLPGTQTYFKEAFSSITEWKGVIGREPDSVELASALENKNVYIYFGHGAGSAYYRKMPDTLDGININTVSIVIGCSSGRIICEGRNTEVYGIAYRFLTNGAPCYVGNLWDVTDKDIDLFSDYFLSFWSKRYKNPVNNGSKIDSLPRSISMSRDFCKLPHLIGSAPVVYGLPLNTLINNKKKQL